MTHRTAFAAALILLSACRGDVAAADAQRNEAAPSAPAPATPTPSAALAAIEQRVGGRLGVALVDSTGRLLLAHRSGERFAMCSTFKLALAAMALEQGDALDTPLPITRADLLSHAPYAEAAVAGADSRLGPALEAMVAQSDNAVANIVLRRLGGPERFTAWLRGKGDAVTRLDRDEPELNRNTPGDPRDTTAPDAMAALTARLVLGNGLEPGPRATLKQWLANTRTGARRIAAGLPEAWPRGDKTGSCGTAWNDVAWFAAPDGREYVLAVYLDRPRVEGPLAEAAIADAARVAVDHLLGQPR